ncbi:MAG: hypothetical protein J0H46_17520 [Bacteroidetes bacterium]|nr:hypothetical protein [Bacteroidota bacterium]
MKPDNSLESLDDFRKSIDPGGIYNDGELGKTKELLDLIAEMVLSSILREAGVLEND